MTDQEKAIERIMDFLEDKNKQILLIKGYDEYAKIKVTLMCLNKKFTQGIIRTSSMSNISHSINGALDKKLLPDRVVSTEKYNMGRMTINFNSYTNHTLSNPVGNENTFTLFVPIQTVLNDSKRYKKFLEELKYIKSRKIILLTDNEWSIEKWDIENHIDDMFFYGVENDNPEIMRNLRQNRKIL